MIKRIRGTPKQKRRATEHWAGGQLFDDLPALQEQIEEAVARKIYAVVANKLAKSPSPDTSPANDNPRVAQLRDQLITCVGWFRNARNFHRRPTPSELGERLRSIQVAVDGLWRALGLPGKAIQAANGETGPHLLRLTPFLADLLREVIDDWGKQNDIAGYSKFPPPPGYSTDLAKLEEALATQSDPTAALRRQSPYPDIRIFELILSLQQLSLWVETAELQTRDASSSQRPRPVDWPLYRTTWELSKVYVATFSSEPTETGGGPWLTFLAEALALAGEGHRSSEALRQIWRKAKRVALASPW